MQSNNALLLIHFELIHRPKCSRNRNTQYDASPQKWLVLTRNSLAGFARNLTGPALHIAGRSNKIVLQFRFGQAAITRLAQSVAPDQFALRAFNAVAVLHALSESVRLLFLTPGL